MIVLNPDSIILIESCHGSLVFGINKVSSCTPFFKKNQQRHFNVMQLELVNRCLNQQTIFLQIFWRLNTTPVVTQNIYQLLKMTSRIETYSGYILDCIGQAMGVICFGILHQESRILWTSQFSHAFFSAPLHPAIIDMRIIIWIQLYG